MSHSAGPRRFVGRCVAVSAATAAVLTGCGRDSEMATGPANGARLEAQLVAAQAASTIVTIDPPGSTLTQAFGINNLGAIVGQYVDASALKHGFLRAPDGTFTTIDAPGAGQAPPQGSFSWSINRAGAIAGQFTDVNGVLHGYVRAPDGTFTTIDATIAGTSSGQGTLAESINERGEVAGYVIDASGVNHGFLRAANGTITTFDAPGGGTNAGQGTAIAAVTGMNNSGAVTGALVDGSGTTHGFFRARDGAITKFNVKAAGTGPNEGTFAGSLNGDGVIAGFYIDASQVGHGFVRGADGTITKFDVKGAGTAASQGTFAQSVNSKGAVTGNYEDTNAVSHGFLRAADGSITKFDAPGAGTTPNATEGTIPLTNNAAGDIVGLYIDGGGTVHGFLRTH
jgi:hypothetical protein